MPNTQKKIYLYNVFDKDENIIGIVTAQDFYHAEEKAIREFENYDHLMKKTPHDDPNRGDLYHEILKHTEQIELLSTHTPNNKEANKFVYNIHRLSSSINKLTEKYTQQQAKNNFLDPNQSTIDNYLQ